MSPDFHDALAYASALHANQFRKGTTIPYVSHLLAVASIVLEAGGTEDEAIAALLHDGPEDQGGERTLDAIRRRFGATVADIVAACSDTFENPKPEWRKRKQTYVEHLKKSTCSTLLVSAADKLHNARATLRDLTQEGPVVWKRFSATPHEILENYANLIGAYRCAEKDSRRDQIVEELERSSIESEAS
jgi:(p)ppGpp synthase/HD superfamily hydrolase